jgi:hypothetical protein
VATTEKEEMDTIEGMITIENAAERMMIRVIDVQEEAEAGTITIGIMIDAERSRLASRTCHWLTW